MTDNEPTGTETDSVPATPEIKSFDVHYTDAAGESQTATIEAPDRETAEEYAAPLLQNEKGERVGEIQTGAKKARVEEKKGE